MFIVFTLCIIAGYMAHNTPVPLLSTQNILIYVINNIVSRLSYNNLTEMLLNHSLISLYPTFTTLFNTHYLKLRLSDNRIALFKTLT